jgi:Zn-dependent protease
VLFEPNETPYDLRFRIFRIPVRVHPMFWLFSAILGWPGQAGSMTIPLVLIWVGAVFVSVLIHEMGHVFMGRAFGSDGYIVLYSFGGLAVGSNQVPRRGQRILVSFAGPLAQFLLLGVVLLVLSRSGPHLDLRDNPAEGEGFFEQCWFWLLVHLAPYPPLGRKLIFDLIVINLFWPVLNLLPIWPLDGGQISREVFRGLMPDRGVRVSLGVSLLVAGLLAVNAIVALPNVKGKPLIPVIGELFAGGMFMIFFFGLFALGSWQALQALEAEKRWVDDRWEQ